MRVRLALVLALLAGALVAVPAAPAGAAATTTVGGPAYAPYWSVVTLTGTTSPANSTVTVYFKKAGATAFSARRTLTSDAGGHFSTTYRADATYAYYASANGVASPIGHTRIPSPTCSVSGPAFPMPVRAPFPSSSDHMTNPFVTLAATNNGLWAGTTFDGYTRLSVTAWRPGHAPRLLETFDYSQGSAPGFRPDYQGSVRAVGVSPAGVVVASIQSLRGTIFNHVGAAYVGGHVYRLRHAADWTDVDPVGISSSGLIVASVRVGGVSTGQHYVVTWAGPTAPYRVVERTGTTLPLPVVDDRGDIAYYAGPDQTLTLRRADGTTARLVSSVPDGVNTGVQQGGSHGLMVGRGGLQGTNVEIWPASTASTVTGQIVTGPSGDQWVTALGPRGDLVTGLWQRRHLLTASRAWLTMPQEYLRIGEQVTGEAINDRGTVAFTEQDGLIHLLRCS